MIGFSLQERTLILAAILKIFPKAKVSLFGSRRGKDFRKDSDLDLLVDTNEPNDFGKKGVLRDQLENDTRLPYRVDLVFRDQISEDFLAKIQPDLDAWN